MSHNQNLEEESYSHPEFLLKDLKRPYITERIDFKKEWFPLICREFTLPTFAHIHYKSLRMILHKRLLGRYTIPSNFHPIESFRLNKALEMNDVSDGFMTQVKNQEMTHIEKYVYTLHIQINQSTTCTIATSQKDDYLQVLESSEMRGLHLFVLSKSDYPTQGGNQIMYLTYYVSNEYLRQKIETMEAIDYYLSRYFNVRYCRSIDKPKYTIKDYEKLLKMKNLKDNISILQPLEIEHKININLYPHQRNSIQWMLDIEKQIQEGKLYFTIGYFTDMSIIKINNQEYHYHPIEHKIFNQETLFKSEYFHHVKLFGGVLSERDESTNRLSMITFLLSSPKNPEYQGMAHNLIITNFRSVSLWRKDIDRIMGISKRVITITTQKDCLKMSEQLDKLVEYEFVVISSTIFNNINLDSIWWNRIIIDMGHEHLTQYYLTPIDLYGSSRKIRRYSLGNQFNDINSNYRWIISHQPFKDGICNFEGYFQYLSADDNLIKIAYNLSIHEIEHMIDRFFYRSDLTSLLNKPKHVIETKFINMDIIQRMVYNKINKNKSDKLLQIVSYITPSDFSKSIYNETFLNHKVVSINTLISNLKGGLSYEYREREKQVLGATSTIRQEHLVRIDEIKKKIKNLEENYFQENLEEPCCICYLSFDLVVITKCWHMICGSCFKMLLSSDIYPKCPYCRTPVNSGEIMVSRIGLEELDDYPHFREVKKYGSKITQIVNDLKTIFLEKGKRVIIASLYPDFLKHLLMVLKEEKIGCVLFDGNMSDINNQIRTYHWSVNEQTVLLPYQQIPFGEEDTIEVSHIFITSSIHHKIEKQILSRAKPIEKNQQIKVNRYISRSTIEEELYNHYILDEPLDNCQ